MEQAEVPKDALDTDKLPPKYKTSFRASLGAMLWLCVTRMDLIADVALLQQEITEPTFGHLRQANALMLRAQKYREKVGLFYRRLRLPLKTVVIADAGANNKKSQYYREGTIVVVMHDDVPEVGRHVRLEHTTQHNQLLSGEAHSLGMFGRRARRISWSTSQGETLAGVGGQELGQMIAVRYTEVLNGRAYTLAQITDIWAAGAYVIPVDHMTDCGDFFELITGDKALPQDKSHRLYVAAFRELRITGRVRRILLVDTKDMLADCLTKSMVSPQMMCLMTTGKVFFRAAGHAIHSRMLVRHADICDDMSIHDIKQFEFSTRELTYSSWSERLSNEPMSSGSRI